MAEEPRLNAVEWKLRAIAVPAALVLAVLFHASPTGHFLQRTFLSMMVHELGHAVTAWFTGYAALPTLWKTLIPETRGMFAPLAVAAVAGFAIFQGWTTQRTWLAAIGIAIGVVLLAGRLGTTPARAQELITFGGDAGAMVLGTLLMMTFFVGPESRLRPTGLRWGFLVIGAAAYVDTFATWWSARTDPDVIPFGEIEGVGLSDPSRLDEVYHWTTSQIVHRYVTAGVICAIALAATWAWAVWRARRELESDAPLD